jgi:hypothetical protein
MKPWDPIPVLQKPARIMMTTTTIKNQTKPRKPPSVLGKAGIPSGVPLDAHLFQVCREWRPVDGQAGLDLVPEHNRLLRARRQLLQLSNLDIRQTSLPQASSSAKNFTDFTRKTCVRILTENTKATDKNGRSSITQIKKSTFVLGM